MKKLNIIFINHRGIYKKDLETDKVGPVDIFEGKK